MEDAGKTTCSSIDQLSYQQGWKDGVKARQELDALPRPSHPISPTANFAAGLLVGLMVGMAYAVWALV